MPDRWDQYGDVLLLLSLYYRCGMLSGGFQVTARVWTLDLDQPFRPTTNGADARPESWTVATALSATTGRAEHSRQLRTRCRTSQITVGRWTARARFPTLFSDRQ